VKSFHRLLAAIPVLVLLISACTGLPAPVTEINVVFRNNFFTTPSWRIIAGREITVRFENQDAVDHEFIVLYHAFTAPFSADEENSTYWRHKVAAASSETVTFKAPAMPANYPVYCLTPGNLDAALTGKLTAVSPAILQP
jgi:hypothetical protein